MQLELVCEGSVHIILLQSPIEGFYQLVRRNMEVSVFSSRIHTTLFIEEGFAGCLNFCCSTRKVDSCIGDALKSAIGVLELDEQMENPRIGAVRFGNLVTIVAGDVGYDRALIRIFDDKWLCGTKEISAFNGKDDASSCVARRSAHKIEPKLIVKNLPRADADFTLLVNLGDFEAFHWRATAASFSTMMRYFQKSKLDFSWNSSSDNKTIIKVC